MDQENKNNEVIQSFGVNQGVPSIRLYEYENVCGAVGDTEFPEEFCLNTIEMGTVVKNQGLVGACVACATSTAIEAVKLRSSLDLKEGEELTEEIFNANKDRLFDNDEISEGYTYGTCRVETSKNPGMNVAKALDYLRNQGTVPKKYFDILEEMPEMKEITSRFPELKEIAEKYRIESYTKVHNTNKTKRDNLIKDALMKYRVPLVCVSPSSFGGPHCICIVGWNDKTDSWKIKNSWGEKYGKKGIGEEKRSSISSEVYLLMDKEIKVPFNDVKKDDWFYSAVKHVYMSDLMNGRTETSFGPNEPMTRAEFATVVSRLMEKLDERFENLNKVLEEKFN